MNFNSNVSSSNNVVQDIGLDSSIVSKSGFFIVQSVDFFYPLIDDPYLMGKIACANVLSDVYATGVADVDSMQMLLSVSTQFSDHERDVILPLIIKGFQDNTISAGITSKLHNIFINPWCIIGGIATSVCLQKEYIDPVNAKVGDALILTKPLGAQIACNANRWLDNPEKFSKISKVVTTEQVKVAFDFAVKNMIRLNRTAAKLMHKYEAHCATDVTGFGICGHANNLAKFQTDEVKFVIDSLPFIKHMHAVALQTGNSNKLLSGTLPETSGGLFICLPNETASDFCNEIKAIENCEAWIIGTVTEGNRVAEIARNPKIIEVEFK